MQSAATISEANAPALFVPDRLWLNSRITRFDILMANALASICLAEALLSRATALTLPALGSMFPWTDCKIAAACAVFCFLYPNPRLGEATRLFFWSCLREARFLCSSSSRHDRPFRSSIANSPQSTASCTSVPPPSIAPSSRSLG